MYLVLKRRAIVDFARLISFPFTITISNFCVAVFNLYFPSNEYEVLPFFIIRCCTGVLMLICLLLTQEMKDGIKLLKIKTRLISLEL